MSKMFLKKNRSLITFYVALYIFFCLHECFPPTDYSFKYFQGSRSLKYNDETVYHRIKQKTKNKKRKK